MSEVRKILGTNIRKLRIKKGWTQVTLAKTMGISPTFMMHIERGTRGVSLDTIGLFAKALNVEISCLFDSIQDSDDLAHVVLPPELQLRKELISNINSAINQYLEGMPPNTNPEP